MSTVNATKVECDEITAKSGAGIPNNLLPLTLAAKINFNGEKAVQKARESINISTVTYNSTGIYTFNFGVAQPSANYTIVSTGGNTAGSTTITTIKGTPTTTSFNLELRDSNGVAKDGEYISILIFEGEK